MKALSNLLVTMLICVFITGSPSAQTIYSQGPSPPDMYS